MTNASQRAGIFAIKQTIVRHQDSLERTDSKTLLRNDYFEMFLTAWRLNGLSGEGRGVIHGAENLIQATTIQIIF